MATASRNGSASPRGSLASSSKRARSMRTRSPASLPAPRSAQQIPKIARIRPATDLLRSLLKAFVQTAPLKIHGYRSLANGSNRVELNDRGEVALVSRFLGDVGAFVDERPADEPGDRRMQLHLLQCEFREPDIGARLIYLRSREVPLRLRLPQLHLRGYFSCAQ